MKRPPFIDGNTRICCGNRVEQCEDCPMKVWAQFHLFLLSKGYTDMAIPQAKDPEIDEWLTDISGDSRIKAIEEDRCINPPIGCGKPAKEFRNEISSREYTISGLCQDCQDRFFGKD